jgi:hypothetical protein
MTAALGVLAATLALTAGPWEPLFNGRDLTGWKPLNGTAPYTVVDGAIVGTTVAGSPNSFLATEKTYGDFILEFEVRQDVGPTNSGVQIRSESRPDYNNGRVHGYQFEIDPSERGWTGGIYDEARRGWFYPAGDLNPAAKKLYKFGEWNRVRIEAIGPSIRTWVNGQPVAHVIDAMTPAGFIALQVHSIGKNEGNVGRRIAWRNLRIQTKDLAPSPATGIFIRNLIPNDLNAAEKAQGWRLLFDGKSPAGWRACGGKTFPDKGWKVADGELVVLGNAEQKPAGGDIVTEEQFAAFELQLEFKLTPGANSGIKYYYKEGKSSGVGFEYQLLDDEKHPDAKLGKNGNRTLASLYDILPRGKMPGGLAIVPRIGEWMHVRIVARPDKRVEHWLNGIKVLEFVRGSPELAAAIAESKFAKTAGFASADKTGILLQEHGNEVHFRSIKIRPLQ